MINDEYNDIITKVLNLNTLISSNPELFVTTMVTVISDSCDYFEATITQTKNIKLVPYPVKYTTKLCSAIVSNT